MQNRNNIILAASALSHTDLLLGLGLKVSAGVSLWEIPPAEANNVQDDCKVTVCAPVSARECARAHFKNRLFDGRWAGGPSLCLYV